MSEPWFARYEQNVPRSIVPPSRPITHALLDAAQADPDRPALISGGLTEGESRELVDASMTYRALLELVERCAAGLRTLGIDRGDRVCLHLPNSAQFAITYYATLAIGGVVVPSNPQYVARELRHQLRDSGARAIVTSQRSVSLVESIRDETALEHVIAADLASFLPQRLQEGGRGLDLPDTIPFQTLLQSNRLDLDTVGIEMDELALLLYTGGTTGTPKGAELTHGNIHANAAQFRVWLPCLKDGEETILTALPLFHSYGMTTCLNLGLLIRARLVLIPNPRVLPHILQAIDKHHVTFYPGVPAMYIAINHYPQINRFDVRSIKACISGAAPLPREVQERFQALTGGNLVEGYGLSEASPVTHVNPVDKGNRVGTIGLPLPSTEARIVDLERGTQTLGPNEPGELVVRGPQVMRGYWQRPEETARVLRDGWLHTGDVASMDEEGYFRLVDRKKDLILGAGGLNVYPREIEEVLHAHPKIKECAVIGVPVRGKGERVKAFVVLNAGASATAEEIVAFCQQNLAPYKVPRFVKFRDQLPKSTVGKTLRRVLRDEELA